MIEVKVSPFAMKNPGRQTAYKHTQQGTSGNVERIVYTHIHLCIADEKSPQICEVHAFFKDPFEGKNSESGNTKMVRGMI